MTFVSGSGRGWGRLVGGGLGWIWLRSRLGFLRSIVREPPLSRQDANREGREEFEKTTSEVKTTIRTPRALDGS